MRRPLTAPQHCTTPCSGEKPSALTPPLERGKLTNNTITGAHPHLLGHRLQIKSRMQQMLAEGADIDTRSNEGETLGEAMARGTERSVAMLKS